MQPLISVMLPTIRPHLYRRCVDSLVAAADGLPYQVVIIADFGPEVVDACTWVVRERLGVIDAMNVGMPYAEGTYLFAFNDESVLEVGALRALYEEAEAHPGQVLSPRHEPHYHFHYYGIDFVPFPFVHRDVIARLGGFLDPSYKAFYADPDFCLRAHEAGVLIRTVERAVALHRNHGDLAHAISVRDYHAADQAIFRQRWAHLGAFHEC